MHVVLFVFIYMVCVGGMVCVYLCCVCVCVCVCLSDFPFSPSESFLGILGRVNL